MNYKKITQIIVVALLTFNCNNSNKVNTKITKTKVNKLEEESKIEQETRKNTSNKDDIRLNTAIGYYFPTEVKDCDFWIKIVKKNDSLQYVFYHNNKVKKTGQVLIYTEDNQNILNFKNSFSAEFNDDMIVFQNYGNAMNSYERIPYCNLKYITLKKIFHINKDELTFYNDKAFYLEQAGLYKEAIYLLEKIIPDFPNRTVAYLYLGDAYWENNEKEKAKKMYKIYIKQ